VLNCNVLAMTSPCCADDDETPRVTVTSSNDEYESLILTTSLPLPDPDAAAESDLAGKSATVPASSYQKLDFSDSRLPGDFKTTDYDMRSRRMKLFGAALCHVAQDGGVFDGCVYSPGGSSSSRCFDDGDDDDNDETVTSHCQQPSPVVSRPFTG